MKLSESGARTGVTTGLCAAAAAKAAAIALFSSPIDAVEIFATGGERIVLDVTETTRDGAAARCAVRKDAGDDPDVTHGATIAASVRKTNGTQIEVLGGEGVGRVTKPGLQVPVGGAAINPAPVRMIKNAVAEVCAQYAYGGGVEVTVSIPGGAEIAKKTMNERLGIVGGLSVLGTTGIVEPMSDRAVVETVKAEIDVLCASGQKNILVTPGNYGRDFAAKTLGIDIGNAVKCSNFIGETLDHARAKGVERLTLIGHAGKLVKLAGGVMNTHSNVADCRMEIIAAHATMAGAGADTVRRVMECATTEAAIDAIDATEPLGIRGAVWAGIGKKIGFHLTERTKGRPAVEAIVFTLAHGVLVHVGFDGKPKPIRKETAVTNEG